ncbi:MAG: tRNA dihydrouridine synthase DusB [bacterium]
MKIGSLTLEFPIVLAPLAGVANSPFRQICRAHGAALVFSEMISAEGILRDVKKTWDLARFQETERPIGIQLFSHDPAALGKAAARFEYLRPDLIDLNFGCPVRKVVQRGAGADFLEDPHRIAQAVRCVVRSTGLPVVVKLRSGPSRERLTGTEAARIAEAEGAAAVTVHARTTAQGFRGQADWEVIAQIKERLNIPVIGNGDVFRASEMLRMFRETGCDGVMIGRGALGNPWIFSACTAALRGETWNPPSAESVWEVVKAHFLSAVAELGERRGVREMRKHLGWYCKGMPGAAQFRVEVFKLDDPQAILALAEEFFLREATVLPPFPRGD